MKTRTKLIQKSNYEEEVGPPHSVQLSKTKKRAAHLLQLPEQRLRLRVVRVLPEDLRWRCGCQCMELEIPLLTEVLGTVCVFFSSRDVFEIRLRK